MTVIYPSPIFGPVHSRRLGVSFGNKFIAGRTAKYALSTAFTVNVAFNADYRPKQPLPTRRRSPSGP